MEAPDKPDRHRRTTMTPTLEYLEISITRGLVTKVSPHRYEHLMQWKWQARTDARLGFYAVRTDYSGGTKTPIPMHRYIMGLGSYREDKRQVDHIDGDKLNNTDNNLRICTNSQNNSNKPLSVKNRSGHRGVCWIKRRNRYCVSISVNGKRIQVGYFKEYEAARDAFRLAAVKYRGEFARLD